MGRCDFDRMVIAYSRCFNSWVIGKAIFDDDSKDVALQTEKDVVALHDVFFIGSQRIQNPMYGDELHGPFTTLIPVIVSPIPDFVAFGSFKRMEINLYKGSGDFRFPRFLKSCDPELYPYIGDLYNSLAVCETAAEYKTAVEYTVKHFNPVIEKRLQAFLTSLGRPAAHENIPGVKAALQFPLR